MPTTHLPPLDGETDTASAGPTGSRPSEVDALHSQGGSGNDLARIAELEPPPLADGVAVPLPAVEPPGVGAIVVQPIRGDGDGLQTPTALPTDAALDLAAELPVKFRLSDAEQIAQGRLDGAAEGSLREALAIAPVEAGSQHAASSDATEPPPAVDAVDATLPAPEHAADAPALALPSQPTEVADPGDTEGVLPLSEQHDTPTPGLAAPTPADASMQPLSSALDAAAKLAADANAAAQALESLQRLLERKMPGAAAFAPAAPPSAAEPGQTAVALPSRPPPVPAHPPRHADHDALESPQPEPPMPMHMVQPRRMPAERMRLDVRGFLAGFALSWAFGIVLYLFMTAG